MDPLVSERALYRIAKAGVERRHVGCASSAPAPMGYFRGERSCACSARSRVLQASTISSVPAKARYDGTRVINDIYQVERMELSVSRGDGQQKCKEKECRVCGACAKASFMLPFASRHFRPPYNGLFTLANSAKNAGGFRRRSSNSAGKPGSEQDRLNINFCAAKENFCLPQASQSPIRSQTTERAKSAPS